MSGIQDATDSTFEAILAGTSRPVIVDFWAPWCGPCKMLDPVLRKIAAEFEGQLQILKVDISVATGLAERFAVRATPTFVLFRDGAATDRKVGGVPGQVLRDWAKEATASHAVP